MNATFGSQERAGETCSFLNQGTLALRDEVQETQDITTFPPFCGGAGSVMAAAMDVDTGSFSMGHEIEEQHTVQAPLDYVVQNLQYRLGNPRNRCYANSPYRLWTWAGSFLGGPALWRKTTDAVMTTMTDDEVVQITHLKTLQPLWERFDDNVQDDASQFLLELNALANTNKTINHYYQVDHRQQVHRREAFPIHLVCPETPEPQEFEQLLNVWANQADGQVFEGEGLWVAQIGRYRMDKGEWTKHHQILQVPSIFNLPITKDGNTTGTEQYSLIGLLCHSGDAHKSGHYFAVYVYRGLYWIVDDGSFPRPIPKLHDALKMQIVQVWAIPSKSLLPDDIPCDFPTHTAEQSEERPAKRPCQAVIPFTFANVTSLGPEVRQWLLCRPRTPIFVVETHLAQEDFQKVHQWFATRGLGVLGHPAASSPKGGTNGGFLVLYPLDQHFHYVQKQVIDGCGWYAVHWSFQNLDLVIVVVYFKCGEGIQGTTNSLLWSALLTFVTGIHKPVIIAGDFNVTPEEFMTTTMSSIMKVQVVATGEDTCSTGRELDWMLATDYLAAELSIEANWIVPFRPHAQMNCKLNRSVEHIAMQQIQRYNPAPRLEHITREWTQVKEERTEVQWLAMATNPLTNKAGQLYSKIERYVLQNLENPKLGRGTHLTYVTKPLNDPSKPWLWRKGGQAFWAQIEVRLQQHLHRPQWDISKLHHLQKLGWHLEEHWNGEAKVTLEGFRMLFNMLWATHDEEHLQVLLKFAKEQRELHSAESLAVETEIYRTWMSKATEKGCRGLYRSLKKDEPPYQRPFQGQPRTERMASRLNQWGQIWKQRDEPHQPAALESLKQKAQQHANDLKPLTDMHVWKTIKQLSQKAPGLDGVGFDFLKALPFQAMRNLIDFFHEVEAQATIPNQWAVSLIALIPKNAEIERPIALVATVYRLWCRLRSPYTRQWQLDIQHEYFWERAMPGTECLQVALKRAYMTEHHNAMQKTVVSVLMDMSNFYDRINLEKLGTRWLDSDYPPVHAALALQVYAGGRILEAEGEASKQIWAQNGILAGDPQAPLAAKIYLQPALKQFHKKFPQLHTDLWIDDLSFDVVDRNPQNAVRVAIAAYNHITQLLQEDDLVISAKKTGFVVSNAKAKALLQQQLPPAGPGVHDVMRDLGIDCTAGRLRRIQTMKQRRLKACRKTKKLQVLKIPLRSIRLKLYKGSIVAGISWGHESMGLAPQVRKRLRATMGRQMGLQRTGNLDILFDMLKRHQDPDYGAFIDQIKSFHKFYGAWPEHLGKDLEKAWQVHAARLQQAKYPWQVAKGPVAALQCYLQEKGWTADNPGVWTKPGYNGQEDFKLDMNSSWLALKAELKRAEAADRLHAISQRSFLHEIQQPLDWLPWHRQSKQLNQRNAVALMTWHQGAIFTKVADGEQHLTRPHCGQEATSVHVLWLCKETNKRFPKLAAEDLFELEHGVNLEFWSHGLLQLPDLQVSTGGGAAQAWGSWSTHDELRLKRQEVVTIGISTTSKDVRVRHFVVAIVHHVQLGGQLFRQGAVITVLPGRQSWERAWYYGVRMVAHYVDLQSPLVVHVSSTRAHEAWTQYKHKDVFHDLQNLISLDQRARIRVLAITADQLKDMPKTEWSLRNRMADAKKAAHEVALSMQPIEQEQILQEQDKKYRRIAPLVVKRIQFLLDEKTHFLHTARESGKQARQQARDHKRTLFLSLVPQTNPEGHQWENKGRSIQCSQCKKRMNMHHKAAEIQSAAEETCPTPLKVPMIGGAPADPKEAGSKTEFLANMVNGRLPFMGEHTFHIHTNYVVCTKCHGRQLKHSSKEKLEALAMTKCWHGEWTPEGQWNGHHTHQMWRTGRKIFCQRCKANALVKGEQIAASKALRSKCEKITQQQQLPSCFRAKKANS